MKRFVLIFLVSLVSLFVFAQDTIYLESFENTTTIFTVSSGGTYKSGTSQTNDRPSNSPFFTDGTYGLGVNNNSVTLTSQSLDLSNLCYSEMYFRLAAFSINSTGNGMDVADSVLVEVSNNGGTTYYKTIVVKGNSNAWWGFNSGIGIAQTDYDGDNVPQIFQPSGGGNRTTDGYSTVRIRNLPLAENVIIRIKLNNNSSNELWVIDEFRVIGYRKPSVQVSNFSFTQINTFSGQINLTRGNGDSVLVVAKEGSSVDGVPVYSIKYTANNIWKLGQQISADNYVIFNSDNNSFDFLEFAPSKTYYLAGFEYNYANNPCYLIPGQTFSFTTNACDYPTVNATNAVISNIKTTSMTLSFTKGNGNRRLVLIRELYPVEDYPHDSVSYVADSVYGLGYRFADGSYVVYNDTGSKVTITNLMPGIVYYFKVYEYNCSKGYEKYLKANVLEASEQTFPENVRSLRTVCINDTSWQISWQNPIGYYDGIIVTIRQSLSAPDYPTCLPQTFSSPNSHLPSASTYCSSTTSYYVYNDTGEVLVITGLQPHKNYTIRVLAYKGEKWSSGRIISGYSDVMNVASFISNSESMSMSLRWKNPSVCFDEVLIVAKEGGNFQAQPTGNGSNYLANAVFGSGTEIAPGEYVVYKGSGNTVFVTNLVNDVGYCFKAFVRRGTLWSSGVQVCDTPRDITYLYPGDLAVVAVFTGDNTNPEEFTILLLKDFIQNSYIDFTDNGYERVYPQKWGTTEGTIRLRRVAGGTIPKGTSITVQMVSSNGNNLADFRVYVNGVEETNLGRWTIQKLNKSDGSGFNLNRYDDIWFMQGGEWIENVTNVAGDLKHDDEYTGRVLFGWTATGWPGSDVDGTVVSYLVPTALCFNTNLSLKTNGHIVKYTGPTTPANKLEWINRINDVNNWTSYSSFANYDAATPQYRQTGVQWTVYDATVYDGIWTGSQSTDWFDCRNWMSLTVPDSSINVVVSSNFASKNIVIDKSSSYAKVFANKASCYNISIDDFTVSLKSQADTLIVKNNLVLSDTLKMTDGGVLFLGGDFTVSDSKLFKYGTGKVYFNGQRTQRISSGDTLIFNKIIVDNFSDTGVVFNTNVLVLDTLNHKLGTINFSESLNLNGVYLNDDNYLDGTTASVLNIEGIGAVSDLLFKPNVQINTLKINRNVDLYLKTGLAANNLIINSGRVHLSSNGFYSIYDNLVNNVGQNGLILHSDQNSTASLLLNSLGVQATCQRFLAPDRWYYIASPLSGVSASQLTTTSWGDNNPNFYYYDETIADFWIGNTLYEPYGWVAVGPNEFLSQQKGYIFYNPEQKTYELTGGNLFVGDAYFNLSYTDNGNGIEPTTGLDWDNFEGWNLIGNPYTCAIDWDYVAQYADTSTFYPVIYYYDGVSQNYKYYGYSYIFNQGITINGGSRFIPANQAFFIKAKNVIEPPNKGFLYIPASARIHSSTPLFKATNSANKPNYIKLSIVSENFSDEVVLFLEKNFDIYKKFSFNPQVPQLFVLDQNKKSHFAAHYSQSYIFPLGLKSVTGANLHLKTVESFNTHLHYLWLKDTKTLFPLFRKNYSFVSTSDFDTATYYVVVRKNNPPQAIVKIPDQYVIVNTPWQFSLFAKLFRDADDFDTLSLKVLVDGQELPQWLVFDGWTLAGVPPKTGIFRISLVASDYLGLTDTCSFNLHVIGLPTELSDVSSASTIVYPLPASDFVFVDTKDFVVSYTLYDVNAKVLKAQKVNSSNFVVDVNELASGVYYLLLFTENKVYSYKFIKK